MHDLLRLARPDLDRLRKVELVLTASVQEKFIHRRQDDRDEWPCCWQSVDLAIRELTRLVA